MRIDWLIPCRYAELADGLATIVGAGADVVHVSGLPAQAGVSAVVRIAGVAEPETEYQLTAQVLGPDFEPAGDALHLALRLGDRSPYNPDGWEDHVMLPLAVPFTAEEAGAHTLEVRIEERSAAVPLHVVVD